MKKKILMRGLFGLPTGIAIGFVITLIISICIGNGSFYPVTPELIDATGNELKSSCKPFCVPLWALVLQRHRLFGNLIRGVLQSKVVFTL